MTFNCQITMQNFIIHNHCQPNHYNASTNSNIAPKCQQIVQKIQRKRLGDLSTPLIMVESLSYPNKWTCFHRIYMEIIHRNWKLPVNWHSCTDTMKLKSGGRKGVKLCVPSPLKNVSFYLKSMTRRSAKGAVWAKAL